MNIKNIILGLVLAFFGYAAIQGEATVVMPSDVTVKEAAITADEFIKAAKKGDIETVKAYIDQGGDITVTNSKNKTALYKASAQGHVEIVKLLLAHPDLDMIINLKNHKGKTALYKATTNISKRKTAKSIQRQLETIRLLVNAGATGADDKCYKGKTAFERLEERKARQ